MEAAGYGAGAQGMWTGRRRRSRSSASRGAGQGSHSQGDKIRASTSGKAREIGLNYEQQFAGDLAR